METTLENVEGSISRIEANMASRADVSRHETAIADHATRLTAIELQQATHMAKSGFLYSFMDKGVWIVISAVLTLVLRKVAGA